MGTVLLKELKVEIMFKDTLSATELLLFYKHLLKKEELGVRKMAQGLLASTLCFCRGPASSSQHSGMQFAHQATATPAAGDLIPF